MTSRIIDNPSELRALVPSWNELHGITRGSVFQTPEWALAWWEVFGGACELRALTLWDGARLAGIFPCFIHTLRARGVAVRRMSMVGAYRIPGEYAPLVEPQGEQALADEAARFCRAQVGKGACDVADFHGFPATSTQMLRLIAALGTQPLAVASIPHAHPRVVIPLPPTEEEYMQSLSYNERGVLRRYERALARQGAEVEVIEEGDLAGAFDSLVALHTGYWEQHGAPGHYRGRPGFEEFHRLVTPRLMARRQARMYFYRKEGVRFAGLQSFSTHGATVLYLTARDSLHPLAHYSPGRVLMIRAIRDAIREGNSTANFLGGDFPYKLRLGGAREWYGRVVVHRKYAPALKGRLFAFALRAQSFLESEAGQRLLRGRVGRGFNRLKQQALGQ